MTKAQNFFFFLFSREKFSNTIYKSYEQMKECTKFTQFFFFKKRSYFGITLYCISETFCNGEMFLNFMKKQNCLKYPPS